MTTITVQQVEAAVRRYFEMMANKIPGELSKMYSYDAMVFGPYGQRADLGRVWATIRDREYCQPESNYQFEFTSPIEVQILADNVAVATHTFRSFANVKEPILGRPLNRKLADGRGTHVFILNSEGELLLAHQHLSDICRYSTEAARARAIRGYCTQKRKYFRVKAKGRESRPFALQNISCLAGTICRNYFAAASSTKILSLPLD